MPSPPIADPDITCTAREYDAVGQVIAEIDANGIRTEFAHDELGRLVRVTDALDNVTEYGFDASGNMVTQEDALHRMTHYEFDVSGKRTARELPLGQRETFTYGIDGAMQTRVDFMGRLTTNVDADNDGRVETLDLPTGNDNDVTTTYWGNGQRDEVTADGIPARYIPDLETGRLERVERDSTPTLAYTHDAAGNRDSITVDPGLPSTEHLVTYTFDAAGRVESAGDAGGSAFYLYDAMGRPESVTYRSPAPASVPLLEGHYEHDPLTGGVETITWKKPGAGGDEILKLEYTLDEMGRRTEVAEAREAIATRRVVWSSDDLYRLTDEEEFAPGVTTPPTWDEHFDHDAVGNRVRRQRSEAGVLVEDESSSHDENDRLLSVDGMSRTWDPNGNLKSRPTGGGYEWDDQDRLKLIEGWSFTYDADGLKRTSTGGGNAKTHVVDETFAHAQVLEERWGTHRTKYLRGLQPVRIDADAETRWYLHDALGSTRALVSINAGTGVVVVTDEWDYRAFGDAEREEVEPNGVENRWLFAGEERNEALKLDYLRARWMEPGVGGFASRDSWEGDAFDPGSRQLFRFADGDPANRVDPSGHMSMGETTVALGLIGAASYTTWYAALDYAENDDVVGAVCEGLNHATEGWLQGISLMLGWRQGTGLVAPLARHAARSIPKDMVGTYVGTIYRFKLPKAVTVFRYWGGPRADEVGRWFTSRAGMEGVEAGLASAKEALALGPNNTGVALTEFIIPEGTVVYLSRIRDGAGWALQVFVEDTDKLILVRRIY